MSNPDFVYPVDQPMTLVKPGSFERAEVVEIRVILTPMRYYENTNRGRELRASGHSLNSVVCYSRIEAQDSRAILYLLRQLLRNMAHEWLGLGKDWL